MKQVLIFFISFNLLAIEPIKKGAPSPVDGYVITTDEEKQMRQKNEDQKQKIYTYEQLTEAHKKIIEVQKEQIGQYQQYNADLDDALRKKPAGFWEKTGWFVLGAVLTGGIAYGTIRAVGR